LVYSLEREFMSIEDIITSAQGSLNDFSIKGKFLITNVKRKIAINRNLYYKITLKDKTGNLDAIRFTNRKSEVESLNSIYLKGSIIEIEGIYQCEWKSMKIYKEKLIENFKEQRPHKIQNLNVENILKNELAPLKELIKLGTIIQRKSYINDVIKPIFDNLSSRKIKQLKKSFEQEIEGWPIEKREEFRYDYAKTFERYESMQPSKWKKWSSNIFKLFSILR